MQPHRLRPVCTDKRAVTARARQLDARLDHAEAQTARHMQEEARQEKKERGEMLAAMRSANAAWKRQVSPPDVRDGGVRAQAKTTPDVDVTGETPALCHLCTSALVALCILHLCTCGSAIEDPCTLHL